MVGLAGFSASMLRLILAELPAAENWSPALRSSRMRYLARSALRALRNSLASQYRRRIHAHRTPSWHADSCNRNEGHAACRGREDREIGGTHTKQQRRHDAAEREAAGEADEEAEEEQRGCLHTDDAQHVGLACAERDAQADLLGALRHGVRHDSVQTDRGEE